jgi:hypothetical protein
MIFDFLYKFVLFSLLAVLQISFAGSLPWYLKEINFFVIFLVFFLEFGQSKVFRWFMFAGFIMDSYYSSPFGFFMVLLPLVFLFARFLSLNFFTNRSVYSCWGLTFFTLIFYYLVFYGVFYFAGFFSGENNFILQKEFWLSLGLGAAVNLAVSNLIFYSAGALTDKLKPFFLIKTGKQ